MGIFAIAYREPLLGATNMAKNDKMYYLYHGP